MSKTKAEPLEISKWFNAAKPLSIQSLKGNVIVIGVFQMLCPGCVEHLVPQLKRTEATFQNLGVSVLGLHSVFEHHDAMTPTALAAFIHEYKIGFPVGVDRGGEDKSGVPKTMEKYALEGTPTVILIDQEGYLRGKFFGHMPDMNLGAEIATLLGEAKL